MGTGIVFVSKIKGEAPMEARSPANQRATKYKTERYGYKQIYIGMSLKNPVAEKLKKALKHLETFYKDQKELF